MLSGGLSNRTAIISRNWSKRKKWREEQRWEYDPSTSCQQTARHDRGGGGQMARMKSGRVGQDSVNSGIKLNRNPVRKESDSARREGGIAPYPLNQQGRNIELYVDHWETTSGGSLVTTTCTTRSCLPLQKKGKINFASSAWTQRGIETSDATYQTLERAKEPITKGLPWNDKARCLHDARIFSTGVIRGRQLVSSRSSGSA